MPDKSSQAAGQVFEPDRPHKSLHVLGRRLKTKALVTGLKAATEPDMPSKPVWGRKLPGGFDSRPPPLQKVASDQPLREKAGGRKAAERARSELRGPRLPHKSFGVRFARHRTSLLTRPPGDRTSLQPPSSRRRGGKRHGPTHWTTHGEEGHHA